jgi:hypothetical protein
MANEGVLLMAKALSVACGKYRHLFGEPLHGTEKQFAALIELCPEIRSAIELWDKRRIELETV